MTPRRRGLLVALVALFGLALLPGAAPARPARFGVRLYHVLYEGSGSYQVKMSDEGGVSSSAGAVFHWKVAYTPLLIGPRPHWRVAMTTSGSGSSGGGEWSLSSQNGEESCAKKGGLRLAPRGAGAGVLQSDGSLPLELTPGHADFTTSGGDSGPGPCDTTDYWHNWVASFSHVGGDDNADPLAAFVDFSPADLRAGKVIVRVSNKTLAAPSLLPPRDCGSGNGATCVQDFNWKGRVTITRVRSPHR